MIDAAPRLATKADAPACAQIVRDWLDATPWMTGGPSLEELTEMLTQSIGMREFWVIGEPVTGYLALEREISQINGLYTAHPGSGDGKALLDAVKQDRDFVQLWTHAPNEAAQRFYAREGFVEVERKEEGRGDGVPELRMEWRA
ncbi:GNAT family N-acetyltransferase [Ascidiaceihabitans sp.]|uniref:GNAT family N-acetyltransferase n=1 Tax=Ascidiaceihabitans sp. TaxID=1872644 RepID=UPI003296E320